MDNREMLFKVQVLESEKNRNKKACLAGLSILRVDDLHIAF